MPCMVDLNSLVLLNSLEREGGVGGGGVGKVSPRSCLMYCGTVFGGRVFK